MSPEGTIVLGELRKGSSLQYWIIIICRNYYATLSDWYDSYRWKLMFGNYEHEVFSSQNDENLPKKPMNELMFRLPSLKLPNTVCEKLILSYMNIKRGFSVWQKFHLKTQLSPKSNLDLNGYQVKTHVSEEILSMTFWNYENPPENWWIDLCLSE